MDSKHIDTLIVDYLDAFKAANPGIAAPEIHFDSGCFIISMIGEHGAKIRENVAHHELLTMLTNLRQKRPIVQVAPIDAEQPSIEEDRFIEPAPRLATPRRSPGLRRRVADASLDRREEEIAFPALTLSRRDMIPREERWKHRLRSWARNKK